MWSIKEVKQKGLFFFKKNYWLTVVVSLILSVLLAEQSPSLSFSGHNLGNTTSAEAEQGALESLPFDASALGDFFAVFGSIILVFAFIAAIFSVILRIFVLAPVEIGGRSYMYKTLYAPSKFSSIADGFRSCYMNKVKVMFLRDLYTFLWSLLFVIPGIVKSYQYRLVPYILSECPDMSANDALKLSALMMKGHKWHSFGLDLSFIGWYILSLCTCGILSVFYVSPYVYMTDAALYDKLKFLYNEKIEITVEEIN